MKDLSKLNRNKLIEFNNHLIKKYKEAGFNHNKYLSELSNLNSSNISEKDYLDELEFYYDKLMRFMKTDNIKNVKVDVFNKLKFSVELLINKEVELTKLRKVCEEYIEHCMSEEYNDDRASDYEHYIFEEALKAVYGTDIFQKMRLANV